MTNTLIQELKVKIDSFNHKLELLLQKGSNDEKIVAKRKELLTQYFELKKQNEKY